MDSTNIFSITPMSQNIHLSAGQVYTGSIKISNPANAANDFHYKIEVSPYGVIGEEYTADLITEYDRSQIVKWIKIEEPTGVLEPNETKEVEFTITVPENAPAGGQYAALLVSSADNNVSNNGITINNVFEMASLIYANVTGKMVHEGEVSEILVPGFITNTPITTNTIVKNNGNSHEFAEIAIEVKNLFNETVYPVSGESGITSEIIMPETTRLITRNINDVSPLGVYHVTETVNYLGQDTVAYKTVMVCPIWFMALAIVTIAAITTFIVQRALKRRAMRKAI